MLDGVDIRTDWREQRALENRGQHSTSAQLKDMEASLPFPLRGPDSDNGGEFINHPVVARLQQRKRPVLFTRSRACRKDDDAHVEQRDWTHVGWHFGHERYDNPAVVPLLNALCKGPLGQLQNHLLPTQKLREKRRRGQRTIRVYGEAVTPYERVMASAEVGAAKKAELRRLHEGLNPFQSAREIERQKREPRRAAYRGLERRPPRRPPPGTSKKRNGGGRTATAPRLPSFPNLDIQWATHFWLNEAPSSSTRTTITFGVRRASAPATAGRPAR
jgi:hypothetical protein